MLEVTFARRAVLDEYSPKLALFKESVNVIVDKKGNLQGFDMYKTIFNNIHVHPG